MLEGLVVGDREDAEREGGRSRSDTRRSRGDDRDRHGQRGRNADEDRHRHRSHHHSRHHHSPSSRRDDHERGRRDELDGGDGGRRRARREEREDERGRRGRREEEEGRREKREGDALRGERRERREDRGSARVEPRPDAISAPAVAREAWMLGGQDAAEAGGGASGLDSLFSSGDAVVSRGLAALDRKAPSGGSEADSGPLSAFVPASDGVGAAAGTARAGLRHAAAPPSPRRVHALELNPAIRAEGGLPPLEREAPAGGGVAIRGEPERPRSSWRDRVRGSRDRLGEGSGGASRDEAGRGAYGERGSSGRDRERTDSAGGSRPGSSSSGGWRDKVRRRSARDDAVESREERRRLSPAEGRQGRRSPEECEDLRRRPPLEEGEDLRRRPPPEECEDLRRRPPLEEGEDLRRRPPLEEGEDLRRRPPLEEGEDPRRRPPLEEGEDPRRRPSPEEDTDRRRRSSEASGRSESRVSLRSRGSLTWRRRDADAEGSRGSSREAKTAASPLATRSGPEDRPDRSGATASPSADAPTEGSVRGARTAPEPSSGAAPALAPTLPPTAHLPSPGPSPSPSVGAPLRPLGNRDAAAMLRARLRGEPLPIPLPAAPDSRAPRPPSGDRSLARSSASLGPPPRGVSGLASSVASGDASVTEMVREARLGGETDVDALLFRGLRSKRGREVADVGLGDPDREYEEVAAGALAEGGGKRAAGAGPGSSRFPSRQEREARERLERSARDRERLAQRRGERGEERCLRCAVAAAARGGALGGPDSRQRLLEASVVASSAEVLVTVPLGGALDPLHVQLSTVEHVPSRTAAPDGALAGLARYERLLRRAAEVLPPQANRNYVFVETCLHPTSPAAHLVVEAVPLSDRALARAFSAFSQAVDAETDDWAQHAGKRRIDTRGRGPVGRVPRGFAYVCVDLEPDRGFVHVVDDPRAFDAHFARETLARLLGLPETVGRGRARNDAVGEVRQRADGVRALLRGVDDE